MSRNRLFLPIILGITLSVCTLFILVGNDLTQAAPSIPTTYHVDTDNTSGTYTGLSWSTAFTNVNDALAAVVNGDSIWVAEGVYYPDEGTGKTDDDPSEYFLWNKRVDLYGGFDPPSIDEFDERDWETYPTVLSGDITQNDTTNTHGIVKKVGHIVPTNARHVVFIRGVTDTEVMDGFTITAGYGTQGGSGMYISGSSPTLINLNFYANFSSYSGGGMFIAPSPDVPAILSHPSLTNVLFSANVADDKGGGIYIYSECTTNLTNVTFYGNSSDTKGGGIYNGSASIDHSSTSNPVLKNVIFSGNSANQGGGMYNYHSNARLRNVTISSNNATDKGGGIANYLSDPSIKNSILWGNTAVANEQVFNNLSPPSIPTFSYSNIQGSGGSSSWDSTLGTNNGNNIDVNPLFFRDPDPGDGDWITIGNNDYGDLHLSIGSPSIDTGSNTGCPPSDLDGNPRPIGLKCDMGAYEMLKTILFPLIYR